MHVTTAQFMILMLIAMLFGLYAAAFGMTIHVKHCYENDGSGVMPEVPCAEAFKAEFGQESRERSGGQMREVSSAYRQCYERLYAMLRRVTREDPALSRAFQIHRDLRQGGLRITEPTYRDAESEALWQLEQIRAEKRREAEIDALLNECQPPELAP